MVSDCNYPPKNIIKPVFGKPNYEFIILWILNNNEVCTWGDLKERISHSTLSTYLRRLKDKGFVEKSEYNQYKITKRGTDRFYELSEARKEERKLNYPPETITKRRNYNHWILWMLSNNNSCKWSDFTDSPLSINQSSLSKNLNSLLDGAFIEKEDKEYIITRLGKTEYSNILRLYELDRQSILEDESKRINEITNDTTRFFEEYDIRDLSVKYRFLNNKLKLPYERVESALDNEDDFNKVLLYLALNHPDQYPDYISPEAFSKNYNINLVKLNFMILRIVDEELFPTKFFKLEVDAKLYYFQVNERLERMLKAIVEDHVTKFTYFNNLGDHLEKVPPLTIESIIKSILGDVIEFLFKPGLKPALIEFLPEYINYLAYKIERKRKLLDTYDKLEGLIWKEVQDIKILEEEMFDIDSYITPTKSFEKALNDINVAIKRKPKEIKLYYIKSKILMYFDKFKEAIVILDGILKDFSENDKEIKLKKASIYKRMRKLEEGHEIIEELIEKYPKDYDLLNYKALWHQYLGHKDESLKIIKNLIEREPDNGIYQDSYGEILMGFTEYELAIEKFQQALELNPNGWYLYQTYIKLGICYREIENYDLALEYLNKGEKLIDQSQSDNETKAVWHSYAKLFIEEIKALTNF